MEVSSSEQDGYYNRIKNTIDGFPGYSEIHASYKVTEYILLSNNDLT